MPTERTNRRERLKEATRQEIRDTARALLVSEGSAGVTVNAVARRMSMSGPALYRYYASQANLIEALRVEFFKELISTMREAAADNRADTPARRLLAICRALRGWAVAHPAEFRWLFASPAPMPTGSECEAHGESGAAFGRVFLEQIVEIWQTRRFPIPNLEDKDPAIVRQVQAYSDKIAGQLPPEAAYVFLACWMRLYGLLCMEILNQIRFAYTDLEPVFEECMADLCGMLDIPYEAPPRNILPFLAMKTGSKKMPLENQRRQ